MADQKNREHDNKDAESGEPIQLDKDKDQPQQGGQQQGAQHGSEGGQKR